MGTVAVILGLAGVLLLLAGLIGGGFSFSGSVIPVVSGAARIPCFFIGGLLIAVSILMAVVEFTGPVESAASVAEPSPVSASTSVEPWVGYVVTPVDVHQGPALDSATIGRLETGAPVEILCTVQGDTVTRTADGVTSSLWDGISGGYVPDVAIDTGTDQPTMGPC
ncbi:hypothetical protein [Amycolatopsis sp. lyj-109]|uniref:hypothetical protein n=1 Tax=Amycolatopsis sp. lyj-109 TaxID=2789287 RepID=UPI003978CE2D